MNKSSLFLFVLFLSATIFLYASGASASRACLDTIEEQVLSVAESQIKAQSKEIRQSRLTLLHHYGCSGSDKELWCYVNSKAHVEDAERISYYFQFQSRYLIGKPCAGHVVTVQIQGKPDGGRPVWRQKADDDTIMLNLFN